jgi:hypothetical protein
MRPTSPTQDADQVPAGGGVNGNARLTATVGAILLIALAVEGVTVFDVSGMFALHAFVGLLLVPVALLKTCSTGYRMVKYYCGNPEYRRRGPPPGAAAPDPAGDRTARRALDARAAGHRDRAARRRSRPPRHTRHPPPGELHRLGVGHHGARPRSHPRDVAADDRRPATRRTGPSAASRDAQVCRCGPLVLGLAVRVASLGWNGDWAHGHDRPK